jgi:hypothetical protein
LIDLAAGNLKQRMGKTRAAYNLWSRSLTRLEKLPSPYMGLDLRAFVEDLQASLIKPTLPLLIRLNF